ncbi:MAG: hypothetical protein HOK80_00390, partial [Candidatus Cloacimonetes bacterium]|nr:hypothetical protein [Candidatus Cloacimonadota bacterium]
MKSLQLIVLFISAVNFTFPQDYFDHSNETADRISKLGVGNTKHETSTIKNEDFLTQNIILENSVMNKSEKFEVMTVKWNEPEDRVLAALVTFMGTQGIIYTIYAAVDPVNLNQPFVDYIESLAQGFVSGVIVGAVEFAAVMLNPVAGTALISLVNTPEFISVIQLAMAPLIEPLFDGTPIITLLTDLPDIFNGIRDEIDNLLSEELDPFIEEFGENQEIENN